MRNPHDVCHVAIPCSDLDDALTFYVFGLGAKLARRYDDRITLDFFGDQLVCHLADPEDLAPQPTMYPRHFGITFRDRQDFDHCVHLARARQLPIFIEPHIRFEGRPEAHLTFCLVDPSNNVIEFKHYFDPRMMY
ncbi:MAG: VOC family protein [Actinomycetia bacterium]|nr:VOC family protein [Actinomycetes bacterium]